MSLSFVFTAITAWPAQSALLAYEGFADDDYTVGATVNGANPGVDGFSGSWIKAGGGDTVVQAGSLAYSAGGQDLVTSGNKATSQPAGRMFRRFDVSGTSSLANYIDADTLSTSANGKPLYISMLVQWEGDPTDAFYGVEFHDPSSAEQNSSREFRFDAADGPDEFQLDFDGSNNNGLSDFDQATHLLVLRIDFASGNDTITYWWDPVSIGGAAPTSTGLYSGMDVNFDKIVLSRFAGNGSTLGVIDEVRLGETYADVTPVPEPGALGLMSLGALMALKRRH
jgi:hypothetical protein